MKLLTKEEEDAHYEQVLKGGTIGGVVGTVAGFAGVFAASKRYPAFRGLTLPFRAFLVSSTGTFGAIINADRYSMKFQRARDPRNSYKNTTTLANEEALRNQSNYDKFMAWGRENRYPIVFTSWLASMGVALSIVGRSPYLSSAQKLVQARMYAQGLTLAVLIVTAAFEMNDAKDGSGRWETVMVLDPNDPEHKKLVEKKIHKEEWEGQDLWKDMVAAEEKRMADKKSRQSV
ncbi:hypothetical protein TD95_004267 [Thielaviopsis punctulata]|uniref:HIG1 domain-containing protein n=1 Tax=Thielaviopsis punctulata TaxID=72032 RepID=A0A0F4Z9I6_9PEZI|nr:hypothetical protein TD95_004267 [Thielaviopsis punctulata]